MQLSKKETAVYQFFAIFLKSTLIFEHFQKKITLVANVSLKLRTAKDVL